MKTPAAASAMLSSRASLTTAGHSAASRRRSPVLTAALLLAIPASFTSSLSAGEPAAPAKAPAPSAPAHESAASSTSQPVTISQILKQANPDNSNQDIIVQRIDLIPGGSAPPHLHPGTVTGYVISGILEFQIEGGPLLTLKAGDTFFEPAGSKHLVARNPGATQKTELVAFVLNPKNTPVAQPLKPHP